MCLEVMPRRTTRLRKEWVRRGTFTVWKYYRKTRRGNLQPPIYGDPRRPIKPGWIISNRPSRDLVAGSGIVCHGIHIHLTKPCGRPYPSWRLVAVEVHPRDFVAAGSGEEAVFMRVFLPKREYDRAIKKGKP